ncbi:conserved protein of unknown function [Rhodovastum atsumiense]|uniref:Uncharacterized protein n=1 Tax=Rhodovastum atsumiense TaxID=504468 RepID=A0A5M6IY71_9PROT|nr:hypothetical protein F1189_08510 [Rhodovastum atsumiense]CAH2602669.1 conserved protein of unknown function [Rhodovastum atsumiense]
MCADPFLRSGHGEVLQRVTELYKELIEHDGYGEITLLVRILKRGQKEVIVRCGKEFRYVVSCAP